MVLLIDTDLSTLVYRAFPFYATKAMIEKWCVRLVRYLIADRMLIFVRLPFVRSDDLLFHSIMLCASLDLDRLRQARTSFRTEKIRQDCIGLLSSRVQEPGESLSDATLVAVATLLAIEHDARNILAMNTHLAGLNTNGG